MNREIIAYIAFSMSLHISLRMLTSLFPLLITTNTMLPLTASAIKVGVDHLALGNSSNECLSNLSDLDIIVHKVDHIPLA